MAEKSVPHRGRERDGGRDLKEVERGLGRNLDFTKVETEI